MAAAPKIDGNSQGRVTVNHASRGVAPRFRAASSSWGSNLRRRAAITRVLRVAMKVTCPITTRVIPGRNRSSSIPQAADISLAMPL